MLEEIAYKYALQNAIKFNGKANMGAVIGKIISELPTANGKEIAVKVKEIIDRVNSMSLRQQVDELNAVAPELLEKKEAKERDIFAFLDIKGGEKITTAFPPGPEKYPHIGHAKALLMNHELARKHGGKFVLRFEDTNPKLVKEEFYKIMLENFEWLGAKWDKLEYACDYMEKFYQLCEDLINKGLAYACTCEKEAMKHKRFRGEECDCRLNDAIKNMELFKKMPEMEEESCIIRMKIDMNHKNTTMRDPALFRIIKHKHARLGEKYKVWPSYDFQNAVMDGIEGITHRLRSKEFEMRNELQRYIQKTLGFKETNIYEFARFELEGVETSGRLIREKINNNELIGWDDPSLATIVALRRRGFQPKAIKDFVLSTGLSKTESTLTWDDLIVHNRRVLDKEAKRFFLVTNHRKIKISYAPKMEAKAPLHPENPKLGEREFKTGDEFYIDEDLKPRQVYRLMHLFNFKDGEFLSQDHNPELKAKIIHWLPADDPELVHVEVLMPDKSVVKGLAEQGVKHLKEGEVCQFERNFFARLDKKEKTKLVFWYTHQ
ncbi:glutamate--tRNA ligase [Candidatus Woesearchaeota archaeon]|nr:glutamate--tRNA ligase [Candidatus Woesearchaeota archaeon]